MGSGLSLVQSYLSAQAYAQARLGRSASVCAATPQVQPSPVSTPFSPSVFFLAAPFQTPPLLRVHPYRETISTRFEELDFPPEVCEYLIDAARSTGRRYSVFLHDNGVDPAAYEVREGTETSHDANYLGDEIYSPVEADFFGTEFVAHIHPPGQNHLPSETDRRLITDRAWRHPGKTFQHIVFGFRDGQPIYTVISSRFP